MNFGEIAAVIGPINPFGELCVKCKQCSPWVGSLCIECFNYSIMKPYGEAGKVRRIRTRVFR